MINNIKHLKLGAVAFSVPDGFDTMREHGNPDELNGKKIFTTTCTRIVDGKEEHSGHYWEDFNYKGQIKVENHYKTLKPIEIEDQSTKFYDGMIHLLAENKTEEKEFGRHIVTHFIAPTFKDTFRVMGGNYGYAPIDSGIPGCQAIYSGDAIELPGIMIADWRVDTSNLNQENIGLAYWNGSKFGTLIKIINAIDHGYNSLGANSGLHKENGKLYLEIAGLLGYYDEHGNINPKDKYRWVTGLMEGTSLEGPWRVINKVLKDENGNDVYATFYKENGVYKALAGLDGGKKEICFAEIVTNDDEPGNGNGCAGTHPASDHINEDHTLPLHSPTVPDNVLLMREIRPILEQWYGEALEAGDEVKMQEVLYMIDLIDEVQ